MRKLPDRWTRQFGRLHAGLVQVLWRSYRDRLAVAAAVIALLAVASVLIPFRSSFPNTDAALVQVVAIVAVAANGHRVAGLLAAVSAAAWFDFFLTAPYERFTITHRTDIETTLLLLLVGAVVTELAVRGRRQRAVAVTEAAYLAAIGSTADLVASESASQVVIDQVTGQLISLLGLRGCRFEPVPVGGRLPRLEQDGRVSFDDGYWDLEQFGMPGVQVQIDATCKGKVVRTVRARSGRGHGRRVAGPRSGRDPRQAGRFGDGERGQSGAFTRPRTHTSRLSSKSIKSRAASNHGLVAD